VFNFGVEVSMKMETVDSSKMSDASSYNTTWHYNPEVYIVLPLYFLIYTLQCISIVIIRNLNLRF
jgi:hypothetical protein